MAYQIDAVDQHLLQLLEQDARMPNQALAEHLGISAPTVRKRIQRLQDEGIMQLVAVTDLAGAGFDYIVVLGVQVEGRGARDVAKDIAQLEQVIGVNVVLGEFDIEAIVIARSQQQLSELLSRQLAAVPGVAGLQPGLCLDVSKFQSNWVSFCRSC